MSYDPNRTTVLPEIGLPITEELPAVVRRRGRGAGPRGNGFLKIVAALLVALIAVAAVLIVSTRQSDQVASTDAAVETPIPTVEPDLNQAPTPVELAPTEPGFWQVTGVPDGLNVRSGPGTDNEIVGSLRAGDRHIFGTGERATVNGAEWTQVSFGNSDAVGWVSSRFLTSDTPPDPNAPTPTPAPSSSLSVVCFRTDQPPDRVARLEFADRTEISGFIRTLDGPARFTQTVTGTLADGQALVTLTDDTGETSQRTWQFGPASVDLGTGTVLRVVDCALIADQFG